MQLDVEIFKAAVLFSLTVRRKFSNSRKGDMSKVQTDAKESRLKLSKQLIESPEYDAIRKYQDEVYDWIIARTNPSHFKNGLYFVKLDQIEAIKAKLDDAT